MTTPIATAAQQRTPLTSDVSLPRETYSDVTISSRVAVSTVGLFSPDIGVISTSIVRASSPLALIEVHAVVFTVFVTYDAAVGFFRLEHLRLHQLVP